MHRKRLLLANGRTQGGFSGHTCGHNRPFRSDLSGTPDYIIAAKSPLGKTELETPLVVVAEAKKNDFEQGWGQCLAELVAAQRLNRDPLFPVYGIVTEQAASGCASLQCAGYLK